MSGQSHGADLVNSDEAMLPHGGVKKSGWVSNRLFVLVCLRAGKLMLVQGRFNAQWGIEEFLKLKTVTYME